MKEIFNVKSKKGSISMFVLVGLLFMTAFLMISYAYNVNKSKMAKEQFEIISDIYSHKDGDANAYERAFTALRNKNKQTLTKTVENTSTLELEKTFEDKVSNYRIYGLGKRVIDRNLPEEYQQIEYIESTGTQYIDTNFIPSGNELRITINFEYTREHGGLSLFGNNWNAPYCLTVFGSVPTFYAGNSSAITCGIQTDLNTIYTLDAEVNNGTLSAIWNGEKYTASYSGDLNTQYEYYIFGANSASGTLKESANGYRLYYFKIYDNNILVRDYVPCCRITDNEIGMYDLVENKFYANAGTGTFEYVEIGGVGDLVADTNDVNYGKYKISIKISNEQEDSVTKDIFLNEPLYKDEYIDYKSQKAVRADGTEESINLPDISTFEEHTKIEVLTEVTPAKTEVEYVKYIMPKLDKGYTELEYIKSTGTQYIKTGITATEKTVLEIDTISENANSVFGATGSGTSMFNLTGNTTRSFRWGSQLKNNTGYSYLERANIIFGQKVYLNGNLIIEYTPAVFNTSEVYLFARNDGGGDNGKVSIYYVKIYEDGVLIRDYIPCYRKSDNVIGLYDLVEKKFYTNDRNR